MNKSSILFALAVLVGTVGFLLFLFGLATPFFYDAPANTFYMIVGGLLTVVGVAVGSTMSFLGQRKRRQQKAVAPSPQ